MLARRLILALALAALVPPAASADSITVGTQPYDGAVNGIRDGKLSLTLKSGAEKLFDLAEVSTLRLDQWPKFLEAEQARPDALKAAALYKALIPTINQPNLKLLAQWRAIDPFDRNGLWTDAVVLFLDVYQAAPAEAVWKVRPSHFPAPGSKMLAESAGQVAAAVKTAKTDEARKYLRTFLLEIYTQAGDKQSADRVARELSTGIAEDPRPTTAPAIPAAALTGIDAALRAKNYDRVLQQADALLPAATGESAVQLFALKALALEGQEQLDPAAAVWLRIPAHYPASPAAPLALLRAAELQQKLSRPQAAQALLDELRAQYPDSKEANGIQRQ